jgi:hypothetical protein
MRRPRFAAVLVAGLTGLLAPALTAAARPLPVHASPAGPAPTCAVDARFASAAAANAGSLDSTPWPRFRRVDGGWAVYVPLIAHEIATTCAPQTPGFAAALALWQKAHGLRADGVLQPATFDTLEQVWMRRRPFVAAAAHGACPDAPTPDRLVAVGRQEGYSGKAVLLRPGTLAAWRALVTAARAEVPQVGDDPRLLTIFSGWRDPAADELRCDTTSDCDGRIARARCSAHRTGLAVDLYLGAAPGYVPESSAEPNRLHQARSPAYLWLVANAARFGFVPYPYEPWHWEWTGEAP